MIFVSYSWRDRRTATSLVHILEEQVISYWIDSKQINLRCSLKPQIQSGLSRSSAVIFLDTSASRVSPWVKFEILQAQAFGIPIIRVRPSRSLVSGTRSVASLHFLARNTEWSAYCLGDRFAPDDLLLPRLSRFECVRGNPQCSL